MSPIGIPDLEGIRREVARSRLRARNGMRLVAGDPIRVGVTSKDEIWRRGKVTVSRYRSQQVRYRPPVIMFLGLVSRPYILDLHPGNSVVERFLDAGLDVFLLDWGIPDAAEADHTLATYVDYYLPTAIRAVADTAGTRDVSMLAYCMGALFAVMLLGSRTDVAVRNLVAMTPPIDFSHPPAALTPLIEGKISPEELTDETTGMVPPGVLRAFFRMRAPTAGLVQYVGLVEQLWREDRAEGHRAMSRWASDHIPFPGRVLAEMTDDYLRRNALITGGAQIGGRPVRLDAVATPTLVLTAERDDLIPPLCSAPLAGMLGAQDVEHLTVPAGHVGLVMGRRASAVSIPRLTDWLVRHSNKIGGSNGS